MARPTGNHIRCAPAARAPVWLFNARAHDHGRAHGHAHGQRRGNGHAHAQHHAAPVTLISITTATVATTTATTTVARTMTIAITTICAAAIMIMNNMTALRIHTIEALALANNYLIASVLIAVLVRVHTIAQVARRGHNVISM